MLTASILSNSELLPPASNRCNGKLCGVRVDANVHPPLGLSQVVDALGNRFTLGFVRKIVGFDQGRLSLGLPFLSTIFELTQILLLFGVHRDHRAVLALKRFHLSGNLLKLPIPVWVLLAFLGFTVGLQTVAHLY